MDGLLIILSFILLSESEFTNRGILPRLDTKYIIQNPSICAPDTKTFIWVHSGTHNFRKRMSMRLTWANPKEFLKSKMAFFMGMPHPSSFYPQQAINYENELYGDIVQENYIDAYVNLSYKALSGARWITEHCQQVELIVKVDDDTLVDIGEVVKHITGYTQLHGGTITSTVFCQLLKHKPVLRKGKWATTVSDYSDSNYPDYCQGLALAMTPDLPAKIYKYAQTIPIFWIDDVWMFGMVFQAANASFSQLSAKTGINGKHLVTSALEGSQMFFHIHSQNLYYYIWKVLQNKRDISNNS